MATESKNPVNDKKTERRRTALIAVLKRTGGDISKSAAHLGVTRTTVYNWMRRDKELAQILEDIREETKFIVEDCLFDSAKKGNVTAQIFILANIYPEKYQHISKIQIGRIENELASKTDDELLALAAAYADKLKIDVPDSLKGIEDIEHEEISDNE